MQVFNVVVRIGGNVGMEVPRISVSASEIQLLRSIHGDDAVVPKKFLGNIAKNQNQKFQEFHSSGDVFRKLKNPSMGDKEHYRYLLAKYEKFPRTVRLIKELFGDVKNPNMVHEIDDELFDSMVKDPDTEPSKDGGDVLE